MSKTIVAGGPGYADPPEYSRYCERHNYWYWPSQGCYMCIGESSISRHPA
jgi:hypothetical protein